MCSLFQGRKTVAFGNVFCVESIAYNHNVYSACVASCRLLQRQPLVFTIDVVILAYAARMGIVFIFQLEHHFAGSVAGTFRQSVYTYGYFRLAVAAHWRQLTPVGFALHFPFAFGIQHQCLRVSVVQCAYRRRTAYQLVMGGNALKLIPSDGCLILWNSRLRHFNRKVILWYAVESVTAYIRRYLSFTYDRVYFEAI